MKKKPLLLYSVQHLNILGNTNKNGQSFGVMAKQTIDAEYTYTKPTSFNYF